MGDRMTRSRPGSRATASSIAPVPTTESLRRSLEEFALGKYAKLFASHGIDLDVFPDLTEGDLEKLGLPVGDRRRFLKAAAALATRTQPQDSLEIKAERRQLTVMFVDLVGSTALASQLDPEDLKDILVAYQNAVSGEVTRFGGYVAKLLGDGLLVYFGWPQAHEDDAERAVRAGLSLIGAMSATPFPSASSRPGVRVGIATGLVVVGDLIGENSAQERVAVGHTLNLAARIQAIATPNSVALGELTRRLAGAGFDYDDLGLHELKGIPEATRVWRVAGESAAGSRFANRIVGGLTPLVGRTEEIALLRGRWDMAKEGDGQLVLLSAPAGFGKSRIVQEFRERLDEPRGAYLQFFGSPFHTNSAFYPFIKRLERSAAIARTDVEVKKLDKLEGVLGASGADSSEAVRLAAQLLSIPFGDRYPPLELTDIVQKERTIKLLEDQVILHSRQGAALILFEDVHWIDPTSIDLMNRIIRRIADLPIMIIATYRPEFAPPWLDLGIVSILKLNHLGRTQVLDLIGKSAGGGKLPDAVVEQVAAKSQGVPLYVEEITRSILESGDLEKDGDRFVLRSSTVDLEIPATLQDSLIARLDRLGDAKDIALTASIIGRGFAYELLEAVSPLPAKALRNGLERLVRSELLGQRGAPPHSRYIFKHALIRDAAYRSILNAQKRQLHERVADIISTRFAEMAETEPELLAHHYTEAGCTEPALKYWRLAAERAAARLAYVEALAHLERAKALLATMVEGAEKDEQELSLLMAEGPSRMALDGWDSPPAKLLYERARTVAERLGRPSELFRSIWGQWMGALSSGRHVLAHDLYEEIFGLLKETSEPEYVVQAHHAGGSQMVAEGRPRSALTHIDALMSHYRMDHHGNLALMYGAHDPGCCSLGMRALSLMMLGYLDLAEEESKKGLDLSYRLGHKPSISQTHMFRAELFVILDRLEEAEEQLRICIPLSEEYSLSNYLIPAKIMHGWVRVRRGEREAGVEQAERALEALKSFPSRRFHLPVRIGIAGLAKAAAGDRIGALALFDEALEAVSTTGERWYEAELLRLKANALGVQHSEKMAEAELCLRAAIDVARRQEAQFFELRAAMSLAKLLAHEGRHNDGYDLLAPVYEKFTEGSATADLRAAEALLVSLRAPWVVMTT
jgi:class 3 adenylate cyclase/predicted ATPase